MADSKISALPASTVPLAGTEVLPIVQGGSTVKVSVANLTAGRVASVSGLTVSGLTASTALALDGSKNLVSVTNTGTGDNVLATSPTLVTPALGTPSALVGTNITGTAAAFNINGTIGATTANTGVFTTLRTTGNVLLGTTTNPYGTRATIGFNGGSVLGMTFDDAYAAAGNSTAIYFARNASVVGTIITTLATTAYNTISDYRLKNTIVPITGALAKVALLKPCTYKWNVDGSNGQGFIAHELAEVVPQCVTGEKDAVDAEGNPQYQGIDTSFLVATLAAAIQELKAEFDAYKILHP
jgi:hypothetical protein